MRNLRIRVSDILKIKHIQNFFLLLNVISQHTTIDIVKLWYDESINEKQLQMLQSIIKNKINSDIKFVFTMKTPQQEFAWFDIIYFEENPTLYKNRFSYFMNNYSDLINGLFQFRYINNEINNKIRSKGFNYVI